MSLHKTLDERRETANKTAKKIVKGFNDVRDGKVDDFELAGTIYDAFAAHDRRVLEAVKEVIEEFADRNDGEILEELGKSAPFPAPCARKTCHLLQERVNQSLET